MVFGGAYGGGIYRSSNGGNNWEGKSVGMAEIYAGPIAVSSDFHNDRIVFTGVFDYVARSNTAGDLWHNVEVNPTEWFYCRSIAVSPNFRKDRTLIAGTDHNGDFAVYRSTNAGSSFTPVVTPFDDCFYVAFSPNFKTDNTVYAGTDQGVFRSVNRGVDWTSAGLHDEEILSLAVSPNFMADGVIFAGSLINGVFKTSSGGASWSAANDGITDIVVETLGISPNFAFDGTVFAGTKSGGVFKSTNAGSTWNYSGLEGQFLRSMAVSPAYADDQTVFLGAWGGIYRTQDGGATWDNVLDIRHYDDIYDYIAYQGNWSEFRNSLATSSRLVFSYKKGSGMEMFFRGDSITWIGESFPWGGIANVYVDYVFQAQVDLYSPKIVWQDNLFTMKGLGGGLHSIRVEVTGASNPHSSGTYVIIDAFESGF
jgi:photosystem II stability/assembly factor-like uncharacterized protein